jgi:hypothetical protein
MEYWTFDLVDRGSIPGRRWEFTSLTPRPDQRWGPTQPLVEWVPGNLTRGQSGLSVKLTNHLHTVPIYRMITNDVSYSYE